MVTIEKFEDLEIWKIAVAIAVESYRLCDEEPLKTDQGIKDQFRRAACSMSDNIAQGFEYDNNTDFIRFLTYAKSCCGEFRNKLCILYQAQKISKDTFDKLYAKTLELSKQTKHLIDYLKQYESGKKYK